MRKKVVPKIKGVCVDAFQLPHKPNPAIKQIHISNLVWLYEISSPYFEILSRLFAGDDQPQQEVDQNSRDAARDKGDDKRKPEPECAYPEELRQPTTHAHKNTIAARTT